MRYHDLAILWVDALAENKDPKYNDALYKEAQNAITNLYLEKKEEEDKDAKA